MKSKIYFVIVVISSITFLLEGCSNNLSRDKAEKLIRESLHLPGSRIDPFKLTDWATSEYPKTLENFKILEKEGLLTYRMVEYGVIKATLTEKGKQYAVTDEYNANNTNVSDILIKLKTARLDLGEITGIFKEEGSNISEVSFTIVTTEVNIFGEMLHIENGTAQKKIYFKKYDDGWKIER